jgi:hypothetical protein
MRAVKVFATTLVIRHAHLRCAILRRNGAVDDLNLIEPGLAHIGGEDLERGRDRFNAVNPPCRSHQRR